MADRSYPRDAIGNVIKQGNLVRVALREAALNFRVVDVQPAGTILSADSVAGSIALNGTIQLVAQSAIEFPSDAIMSGMLVLREPEPDAAATPTKQ